MLEQARPIHHNVQLLYSSSDRNSFLLPCTLLVGSCKYFLYLDRKSPLGTCQQDTVQIRIAPSRAILERFKPGIQRGFQRDASFVQFQRCLKVPKLSRTFEMISSVLHFGNVPECFLQDKGLFRREAVLTKGRNLPRVVETKFRDKTRPNVLLTQTKTFVHQVAK